MGFLRERVAVAVVRPGNVILAAVGATLLVLAGCSNGGLTESSTCKDFLNAPSDQQDQVVNSLAGKYQKPDYTSPLGRPEIPYYCASHPDVTLGQFFAGAQ